MQSTTGEEWLSQMLPRGPGAEDRERRQDMFRLFDRSQRGRVDEEEALAGCTKVVHLDRATSIWRSTASLAFDKTAEETGEENLRLSTFQKFLCHMYDYYELTAIFGAACTPGQVVLTQATFTRALGSLCDWGVRVPVPAATFAMLDTKRVGYVSFEVFAGWTLAERRPVLVDAPSKEDESWIVEIPAT